MPDLKRIYGATKTLMTSGAAIANNAVGQATTSDYSTTDTANFPDGIFVLTAAFSGTPATGSSISLIIRPMDIDGTTDAAAPTATALNLMFGQFFHNNGSASQTMYCEARNIPANGQVWLYNNATGVSINSAWVLKLTPLSLQSV